MASLSNILWILIVALLLFWLLGVVANIGGAFIHFLLVIVVIVLVYQLLTGRKTS